VIDAGHEITAQDLKEITGWITEQNSDSRALPGEVSSEKRILYEADKG
jgi:hypothetical protein